MALFEQAIRDHLAAQGLLDGNGDAPVWWVGAEQDQPDFSVTVIPEAGGDGTRRISEFPSFSVRVRHPNAAQAHLMSRRIFELLQEFQGRLGTNPTWPVARITAIATPVPLGRDRGERQGRWRVTQTFNAITRFVTQP